MGVYVAWSYKGGEKKSKTLLSHIKKPSQDKRAEKSKHESQVSKLQLQRMQRRYK